MAGAIQEGVCLLVGIVPADTTDEVTWLCQKIVQLRIFPDENGVMNRSLLAVAGEALVVSQFTLHAQVKKGNRPSYIRAANRDVAVPLYAAFVSEIQKLIGVDKVATGIFGTHMDVALLNDGPVTLVIDTEEKV